MSSTPQESPPFLSLLEVSARLRRRELSPVALTELCLERIAQLNPRLNAFITVLAHEALETAVQAEREMAVGNWRGPLHGVPVAVKDLIDVAGTVTTGASRAFADDPPATEDAPVVRNLRDAGAIIVGKTNLHELAYGGSGAISAYGAAANPWDESLVAGGSSSGSAAAVAAGLCYAAIGTDTAGSIRVPASCCGLIGLKPTYGLVSAEGVIPLAVSYDHVGPIARNSADALAVLEAIAPRASFATREVNWEGTRVGVPHRGFCESMSPEVENAYTQTLERIRSLGAILASMELATDADRTLASAESFSYHRERIAEGSPRRSLYDPRTLVRIETGANTTDEQIACLREKLAADRRAASAIFEQVDLLLTPTMPIQPPPLAEFETQEARALELIMLRNTRPFNVLGLPTVNVPVALSSGVPIGMQLTAASYEDGTLLRFSAQIERAFDRSCAAHPVFK
jgi:Asp-tRNA(Asn)/Glu-tRNA(Gln) amidotransferase A subunit family amidase